MSLIKEDIILLGGGGHCKSCIDVIEQQSRYTIAGILDTKDKVGNKILGYPVIGIDDDIVKLKREYRNFFITVGMIESSKVRLELFIKLKKEGINLPTIASPYSYISKHSVIGEGTIVMHDVIVNAGVRIGANCIINSRALIEHDSVIGDHCHISTGAIINGNVIVGDSTFFGSGAVCIQGSVIQQGSFIRANSLAVGKWRKE